MGENGVLKPQDVRSGHSSLQDEETPLLPDSELKAKALTGVGSIIAVLLLGEFIANADSSLVMAATGRISSEFNRLRDASWLSTGYTLGVCAAQPVYGKLSDIYGRKPVLLVAYFLFGLGCLICGIGSQMWVVVLGRAISGMGGAGIMTVGSVIITDIVPKRDVAIWRAYVNISMTLGRGVGGPLGGWLTDTIGWRWSFILQAPLVALAALLVVLKLPALLIKPGDSEDHVSRLRQVDFLGASLLGTAIMSAITLLDQGGKTFPWRSWWTLLMGGGGTALLGAFVVVEAYVAREPIFNLRILRRTNVPASYIAGTLQVAAQVSMMFSIPLYFQVTQRVSTTVAGGHLVPAVVGNTVGAMLAGMFIKRTGSYKILLIAAGLVASVTYILLYLRWNGSTGFWESLYIIPGGMGTGIAAAAAFVAMTALLPPEEVAMATSGFMLLWSFGMTVGVTTTNAVLGLEFQRQLRNNLRGPDTEEVIKRVMSDTGYIAHLEGRIREIVVSCYVSGLKHAYLVSLACSLVSSCIGWFIKNSRI